MKPGILNSQTINSDVTSKMLNFGIWVLPVTAHVLKVQRKNHFPVDGAIHLSCNQPLVNRAFARDVMTAMLVHQDKKNLSIFEIFV